MSFPNSAYQNPNSSAIGDAPSELLRCQMATVDISPGEIVRHRTEHWRGVQAEIMQIIGHVNFELRFKAQRHLLIATEQAARYEGETVLEGLPASTVRNYSQKLILVPAGRTYFVSHHPRLPTRSIYVYIDPQAVPVDPDLGFAQADLKPRLFFEDCALWQTIHKLKAQVGSADPGDRMYAEALGGLLAHELLRLQGAIPAPRPANRGGLAGWQRKRVIDFMEAHLVEDISLKVLADLVRLSPHHFLRSFKQSFGAPPYRYWTGRRIARAKALLVNPRTSITEIALDVGFSGTSAFSATFHRITGQTPTDYRRSLA